MYGRTFEFTPQGKILLATNHKPKIYGTDHAIWRRIVLIPFNRTFSDKEKDPVLADKLSAELPGMLNWALQGFKEWERLGLKPPDSVRMAVQTYREDMDVLGSWIEEKCEIGSEYQDLISSLYSSYVDWTKEGQEYLLNKTRFVRSMEDRGFVKAQTTRTEGGTKRKGWFLKGLRLVRPTLPKHEHK